MGFLLYLCKPVFYLVVMLVGARWLLAPGGRVRLGPWNVAPWLASPFYAALRLAIGIPGGSLAFFLLTDGHKRSVFIAVVFVSGLLCWLATLRLAYRAAPMSKVLTLAVLAEIVCATIDTLAAADARTLNFC